MSDLSNDEIESIERSLGGPSRVAVSNSETCRMLHELKRRRAEPVPTERQIRHDVLRALGEFMRAYADTSAPFDAARVADEIAGRTAKELVGSAVSACECDRLRSDVTALTERRDALLQLVAKLTRETPYPAELDECRSARSALIAEVGTLRARCEELMAQIYVEAVNA